MAKIQPVIRKSGRHWVIDRGPNEAMPCCDTKAEAEQLLALAERWEKKKVRITIHGQTIVAKVVNTAVLHHKDKLVGMLGVRWRGSTYWWPATDCEEVKPDAVMA